MNFRCAFCGEQADRPAGHVNRSRAAGNNLYCSRDCSGLGRRTHKTKAQKVEEKRLYDKEYRARNLALIKAKKRAYFAKTYDPATAAVVRKARMPYHVEYCRRPEYKAKKREYDKRARANEYGPFADCFLLLQDIQKEVLARMSRYEIGLANGTINKNLKRRRDYESLVGGQS